MIRTSKALTIFWKDMKDLMQSKYVLLSFLVMPFIFGVFIPVISIFPFLGFGDTQSSSTGFDFLPPLTNDWNQLTENQKGLIFTIETMNFMLLLLSIVLPTVIAADSFVGEKDRRTIVTLLLLPITDTEIYLGKVLSTIVPTIIAIFIGSLTYFSLVSYVTVKVLGYFYLLNYKFFLLVIFVSPLLTIATTNLMIWVSTRTSTTRDAQQLGSTLSLTLTPLILIAMLSLIYSPAYFAVVIIFLGILDYLLIKLGLGLMDREKLYTSL